MGQSVIEINGTRYDASTGRVIVDTPKTFQPTQASRGNNIDGVVSSKKTISNALAPTPMSRDEISKSRRVHNTSVVHSGKFKKSKTLMRSVVKKPGKTGPVHVAKPTHLGLQPSPSYSSTTTSVSRLHKALRVSQHSKVSRFPIDSTHGESKVSPTLIRSMPVAHPLKEASSVQPQPQHPNVNTHHTTLASQFVDTQLSKASTIKSDSPFKKKPLKTRARSVFKTTRKRTLATGVLTALLIAGFLVYQNLPSFTLALANRNAGISAKMPSNIPSNFALSPNIHHSPGQVVMSFSSRVDDRAFTLTQTQSDMTIETLKEFISYNHSEDFTTYQSNGMTFFIGGERSVDWLDGGILYSIDGVSGLSTEQLSQMASSL